MKQFKYALIGIALMLCFSLFRLSAPAAWGNMISYVVTPVFWLILALLFGFVLKGQRHLKQSVYLKIRRVALGLGIFYFVLFFMSGLLFSYGRNPLSASLRMAIINLLSFGSIIPMQEWVRARMMPKQKKNGAGFWILLCVISIFIIYEMFLIPIPQGKSLQLVEYFGRLLAIIMQNVMLCYLAYIGGWIPALLYRGFMAFLPAFLPIIPNVPWIYEALLDIFIPFIGLLFLNYYYKVATHQILRSQRKRAHPAKTIPAFLVLSAIVFFFVGLLPVRPVVVATGSMQPQIYAGDMVIIQDCNIEELEVGDVLAYRMPNYTVIHRVIEIQKTDNNAVQIIAQGDNNNTPDVAPISADQVSGKVVGRIPKIGYLTLWMNEVTIENTEVEVET